MSTKLMIITRGSWEVVSRTDPQQITSFNGWPEQVHCWFKGILPPFLLMTGIMKDLRRVWTGVVCSPDPAFVALLMPLP
jgi:hypothetical protein